MKGRDILLGLVILAGLIGGIYWFRGRKTPKIASIPTTEKKFEENFKIEIPEDLEKAELSDTTGGDGSGIATRNFEVGLFTFAVLADLPDPAPNFYEGWLVRGNPGDTDFNVISTGKMREAKGGWLLDFESPADYSDHTQVVVTLETVADATPEKHILEGSF